MEVLVGGVVVGRRGQITAPSLLVSHPIHLTIVGFLLILIPISRDHSVLSTRLALITDDKAQDSIVRHLALLLYLLLSVRKATITESLVGLG